MGKIRWKIGLAVLVIFTTSACEMNVTMRNEETPPHPDPSPVPSPSISPTHIPSPTPSGQAVRTLLDYNEPGASETSWAGWTWRAHAVPWSMLGTTIYGTNSLTNPGNDGWTKDSGRVMNGSWFPRTFAVNGYGANESARIDATIRAPGTASGASLKVFDSLLSSVYRVGWWYLWGDNFDTLGLADATTNRLDFYIRTQNMAPLPSTGGFIGYANMHFGTYQCWAGGGLDGASCPKEAGNAHYYHYLLIDDGAWIHVQLDPQPTHRRGENGYLVPAYNPPADGVHGYFQNLNGFYFEMVQTQTNPTAYWIDEIRTWTQPEPENDRGISSPWVGYWPERVGAGKWEIGFQDASVPAAILPAGSHSTYEIRYSTAPITNANFSSATPITPELYVSSRNPGPGRIQRTTVDTRPAVTRFSIPDAIVQANSRLYFAVKDVSSRALGNGHDAASSLIRTIDYAIRPSAR